MFIVLKQNKTKQKLVQVTIYSGQLATASSMQDLNRTSTYQKVTSLTKKEYFQAKYVQDQGPTEHGLVTISF